MSYPDPKPEADRLLAIAEAHLPDPTWELDGNDLVALPAIYIEIDRLFDYLQAVLTPAMVKFNQREMGMSLVRTVAVASTIQKLEIRVSYNYRAVFEVTACTAFASSPAWLRFTVQRRSDFGEPWTVTHGEEIGCLAELPDRWEWRFVDPPHRGNSTGSGVPIDQLRPLLPGMMHTYLESILLGAIDYFNRRTREWAEASERPAEGDG